MRVKDYRNFLLRNRTHCLLKARAGEVKDWVDVPYRSVRFSLGFTSIVRGRLDKEPPWGCYCMFGARRLLTVLIACRRQPNWSLVGRLVGALCRNSRAFPVFGNFTFCCTNHFAGFCQSGFKRVGIDVFVKL